jgi:gluconolactonase
MYSSDGSRRSFMAAIQPALDQPVKQCFAPAATAALPTVAAEPELATATGGRAMDVEITEITSGLRFPEGPVWMPDGSVLCTELLGGTVVRVQVDGNKEVVSENGGSPNGLAIGPDGDFVIPDSYLPQDHTGGRIERVDLATGEVTVLYRECEGHDLIGPNDLVFDDSGGFWFTDHGRWRERDKTHGGLYHARADGSEIREIVYPLDGPNGVGLSPDGKRVYAAETFAGRLFAWDLAGPGELAAPPPPVGNGGQLVCGLPGMQLFDSLAVDGDGNVVVATLVNGGLTVVAPDGSSAEHVSLPDPMVTNVCFGGDGLRTAFVTCSATGKLVSMPWARSGLKLAY